MANSFMDTLVAPVPSLRSRGGFAKLLVLILGAYALTIVYSFNQLSRAIETRDVALLRDYVDWPAVRDQLKADLAGGAPQDATPRPIFDIGRMIVGGLNSIMVDAVVTPERIGTYLDQEQIRRLRVTDISRVGVLGPNEYSFQFRQFRIFVRRADLVTWKVVRVAPLDAAGAPADMNSDGPALYEQLLSPKPHNGDSDNDKSTTPAYDRDGLGRLIRNATANGSKGQQP